MSGQIWTPAPRRGVVPLHPMNFGMILSKSFAMLRHNPRVLFGFAVVVQLLIVLASAALVAFTLYATVSRLETLPVTSPEYATVAAGAVAWNVVAGFVAGLISTVFIAIVQGLIAADVSFAALGLRARLPQLWARIKPVVWRLIGYAVLVIVVVFAVVALVFGGGTVLSISMFARGNNTGSLVIVFLVLAGLASIPLIIWISTKLMLTPATIVLEGATIRQALVRSWRLIRGRFWPAFGVMFLISMIMGFIAQVVVVPFALVSGLAGTVLAPTGSPDVQALSTMIIALLIPQVLAIVIQAITTVVQSSASTLVYLDCRMRYEGLDQTLLAYLERRNQGVSEQLLGDPFALDPARAVRKDRPLPPQQPAYAPGYQYAQPPGYAAPPAPGYAQQLYQQQSYAQQSYAQPGFAQQPYPQPGFAQTPPPPHPAPAPQSPPPDADDGAAPPWVAPGSEGR